MIILEASDVLDNNGTFVNGTEIEGEGNKGDHVVSRLARETNITKDEDGNLLVQLPKVDNSSADVHVGRIFNLIGILNFFRLRNPYC